MELMGYVFHDPEMFEKAKKEESAIVYIKGQVDKNNPEALLKLYCGLIQRKFFSTIIGLDFLRNLQEELLRSPLIDPARVPAVPEYLLHHEAFSEESEEEKKTPEINFDDKEYRALKSLDPDEKKILTKTIRTQKKTIRNLFLAVIALFIVAVSMVVLTFTSKLPTIVNYETKIQNRYSEWENELNEREQEIRAREQEVFGGDTD